MDKQVKDNFTIAGVCGGIAVLLFLWAVNSSGWPIFLILFCLGFGFVAARFAMKGLEIINEKEKANEFSQMEKKMREQ